MIILGLNAFHADSAAAIVRDGVLVAAAESQSRNLPAFTPGGGGTA
jgi:predicted NodU family carbamoyl transferase